MLTLHDGADCSSEAVATIDLSEKLCHADFFSHVGAYIYGGPEICGPNATVITEDEWEEIMANFSVDYYYYGYNESYYYGYNESYYYGYNMSYYYGYNMSYYYGYNVSYLYYYYYIDFTDPDALPD